MAKDQNPMHYHTSLSSKTLNSRLYSPRLWLFGSAIEAERGDWLAVSLLEVPGKAIFELHCSFVYPATYDPARSGRINVRTELSNTTQVQVHWFAPIS
jgi:hypothetical protein